MIWWQRMVQRWGEKDTSLQVWTFRGIEITDELVNPPGPEELWEHPYLKPAPKPPWYLDLYMLWAFLRKRTPVFTRHTRRIRGCRISWVTMAWLEPRDGTTES